MGRHQAVASTLGIKLARLPGVVPRPHLPPGADARAAAAARRLVTDWTVGLLFGRDSAELGQLGHPPELEPKRGRPSGSVSPGGTDVDSGRRRVKVRAATAGRAATDGRLQRPPRREPSAAAGGDLDDRPGLAARPQPPRRTSRSTRTAAPSASSQIRSSAKRIPNVCTERQRGRSQRRSSGRARASPASPRSRCEGEPGGGDPEAAAEVARAGRSASLGVMLESSPGSSSRAAAYNGR